MNSRHKVADRKIDVLAAIYGGAKVMGLEVVRVKPFFASRPVMTVNVTLRRSEHQQQSTPSQKNTQSETAQKDLSISQG